MSGLWSMVKEGGVGALLALFLGIVGLFVAVGAGVTVVASRRAAFYVGIAALVTASLASGVGILGMAMGWRNTQAAVSGGSVDAVQRDRILREGFRESQGSAKIGFGAAMLPLLLGAAAAVVGAGAKRAPAPPAPWQPSGAPPPTEPKSGGRYAAAGLTVALALLTTGGALAATFTSPPKGKYDFAVEDSEAWELASAREQIDTDAGLGCDKLDQALDELRVRGVRTEWPRQFSRSPDALVPDWRAVATTCARGIWTHVEADGEWTRPTTSAYSAFGFSTPAKTWSRDALLESPLLVDEALHTEILAAVPHAPGDRGAGIGLGTVGGGGRAHVRLGATTVNGRLPPEVIVRIVRQQLSGIRACYVDGLARTPTLSGTVRVKLVIDRAGSVSSVADAGSDLPDAAVKACVLGKFKDLTFPAPEGGIVTVVYPVIFDAVRGG